MSHLPRNGLQDPEMPELYFNLFHMYVQYCIRLGSMRGDNYVVATATATGTIAVRGKVRDW
jgi:hypothetical protein